MMHAMTMDPNNTDLSTDETVIIIVRDSNVL